MGWTRKKARLFWIKLRNWEYWPTLAFYWPMCIYGPLLALRYRHPCFFSAANPGVYISGLGLESKYETLQSIPIQARPRSIRIKRGTSDEMLWQALEQEGLRFPLVAKPDIGFRGLLVAVTDTFEALAAHLRAFPVDFIVQEFLDFPEEVGVFYVRFPGADRGRVVSLTLKQFLGVSGDGQSSVRALIEKDSRAWIQVLSAGLGHLPPASLESVPEEGSAVRLSSIGNHSRGTRFINGSAHIDEALHRTFDELSRGIPGFYYGRFDVKCESLAALKQGKNFKIIELNGIGAEPTQIYDQSSGTYLGALATIMRYWTVVARISAANHDAGAPYISARDMLRALAALRTYLRGIKRVAAR